MKKINNKYKYLFVVTLIIIGIVFLIRKGTYSIQEYSANRAKLQDLVVSTALSYYYNNNYSDYEQKSMDYYYTDNGALEHNSTFMWRNFNNTPEDVGRSNFYNFDCSSFVSSVYLYSLGYDFSDYRDINSYTFRNGEKFTSYDTSKSVKNFQNAYLILGKGQGTSLTQYELQQNFNQDSNNPNFNSDKTSEFVYYYEVQKLKTDNTYKESTSVQNNIRNTIINNLQPGDILHYRRHRLTDGKESGHVLIYVGDLLGNGKHGFIHSTGTDFNITLDSNQKEIVDSLGDDKYTVRYDTWEDTFESYIFINSTWRSTSFAIIRPINKYCDDNSCIINSMNVRSLKYKNDISMYLENAIARDELSNMRVEQYQFLGGTNANILNKYNSVNIGDTVSYRLSLTNKNTFKYCSSSNYDNQTDCENNNKEWITTNKNMVDYNNIQVTAKIPEGSEYVDGSCYFRIHNDSNSNDHSKCSYDASTRTVTWDKVDILANQTAVRSFNYKVKPVEGSQIVNDGMTITTGSGNKLQMGKMSVLVNSTINKSSDITKLQAIIDERVNSNVQYGANSGIKFIRDIYSKYLYDEYLYDYNSSNNSWEKNPNVNYLDELSSYSSIRNAIFIDRFENNTDNKAQYYRRVNYSSLTPKQQIINNMLVPGEYGGKWLRYNINGDRARILFKYGYKTTLEVGDVIIAFNNSDMMYRNFANQLVWIFYGYDENNQPIFVRCYKNGDVGSKYITNSGNSTVTGYEIYKKIYSYDLFMVLRPTRAYSNTYKYNINYAMNGAKASSELPTQASVLDVVNIPNPTKDITWHFNENNTGIQLDFTEATGSQVFTGWTLTNESETSFNAVSGNNTNTLSKWDGTLTKNTYFSSLGFENDTVTLTANWQSNETIQMPTIEKNGYTCFWSGNKAGTSSTQASSGENRKPSVKASANYTWYAHCDPGDYSVAFDSNDGVGEMSNYSTTFDTEFNLPANTFTREGYTFTGWNTLADGTGTSYDDEANVINLATTGMTTLYAQWIPNEYIIKFNNNTGVGNMSDMTVSYNEKSTLSINSFTKVGYSFSNWNTEIDGSGTAYTNEASIKNLTSINNDIITLYAQWIPNEYTVVFDGNGGVLESEEIDLNDDELSSNVITIFNVDAMYDETFNIPDNQFIMDNAVFIGWNTLADGTGTSYSVDTEVLNLVDNGSITLYAQWEKYLLIDVTDDLLVNKQSGIIGNVTNNTLIDSFIDKLTINGEVQLLDHSKNPIADRDTVRGGDYVRIINGSDLEEYMIIISGDVNQDLSVDSQDLIIMAKYIINNDSELGFENLLLGDSNHDGMIKMNDIMIILLEIKPDAIPQALDFGLRKSKL